MLIFIPFIIFVAGPSCVSGGGAQLGLHPPPFSRPDGPGVLPPPPHPLPSFTDPFSVLQDYRFGPAGTNFATRGKHDKRIVSSDVFGNVIRFELQLSL